MIQQLLLPLLHKWIKKYVQACTVYRKREVASFELCKEIERDVLCLVMSVGQRKNSESPWEIEPQIFGFHTCILYLWATETLWWARPMNHRDSMVSQAHEPQGLDGEPGPWATGTLWWPRPMIHRDSMVSQAHEPQGLYGAPGPWATGTLWCPRPMSHRDSVVSQTHYKVHIWHTSCILLGSAISIALYFEITL